MCALDRKKLGTDPSPLVPRFAGVSPVFAQLSLHFHECSLEYPVNGYGMGLWVTLIQELLLQVALAFWA